MANLKSSRKAIRRDARRTERNRRLKSRLKTLRWRLNEAAAGGTGQAKAAAAYISALDKAAKSGIVHRNKASRHKSACARHFKP